MLQRIVNFGTFSRMGRAFSKRKICNITGTLCETLTQVYNKNLINVDGSNISLQLRKRRESARHIRHALLSDDQTRRRNTASAGLRRKTKDILKRCPGFEIRFGKGKLKVLKCCPGFEITSGKGKL